MLLVNSAWRQGGVAPNQSGTTTHPSKGARGGAMDSFSDDFEIAMKVVIVGNGSVGKSSMIQRFCRGIFTRDYKKTIGVDFLERVLFIPGGEEGEGEGTQGVRLMLWDTAGQEEFDAITRTYYRGAHACVLACSLTDKDSFLALPKWKNKVCREVGENIPMVLVANKTDLHKESVVDAGELEGMGRLLGVPQLFRTSVKDDLNVNAVFTFLAEAYVEGVLRRPCTPQAPTLHEEEGGGTHLLSTPLVPPPHKQKSSSSSFFSFKRSSSSKRKGAGGAAPIIKSLGGAKGAMTHPNNNNNNKSLQTQHQQYPPLKSPQHPHNNNNGLLPYRGGGAKGGYANLNHYGHHYNGAGGGYYRGGGGAAVAAVGYNNNRRRGGASYNYMEPSRWTDPNIPFRLDYPSGGTWRRKKGGFCTIL